MAASRCQDTPPESCAFGDEKHRGSHRGILYDPVMSDPAKANENLPASSAIAVDGGTSEIAAEAIENAPVETQPDAPAVSPRRRQRSIRRRHLLLAVVLTGIFVFIVLWSSGVLHKQDQSEMVAIAPAVLFEDVCKRVAEEKSEKLHVTGFEVTDAMIPQIIHLDSIETLIIDQGKLTDRSLVTITALPKLRHLRLRLSPITDEGLKTLAQCETLWYVNLPHAECTAEGVAALAQLPRLRQLRLGSTQLGNEVTDAIATIESLRGLHLIGIAVTDEGLKTIAALPNLESLYLDDAKVTEAGWQWLFKTYPQLHVHVNQRHHDYDPKAHRHHEP